MNMLSLLPVFLLGIVAIWFVWPLVADPINRRFAMRAAAKADVMGEDLFRALADRAGPKHDLNRAERG